jgi:hypothetical protein
MNIGPFTMAAAVGGCTNIKITGTLPSLEASAMLETLAWI